MPRDRATANEFGSSRCVELLALFLSPGSRQVIRELGFRWAKPKAEVSAPLDRCATRLEFLRGSAVRWVDAQSKARVRVERGRRMCRSLLGLVRQRNERVTPCRPGWTAEPTQPKRATREPPALRGARQERRVRRVRQVQRMRVLIPRHPCSPRAQLLERGAIIAPGPCFTLTPASRGASATGENATEDSYALEPSAPKGMLLLHLNGSGGKPSGQMADPSVNFYNAAVSKGYHVLGLAYRSETAIGKMCSTDTCYGPTRQTIILGTVAQGSSAQVADMATDESIVFRAASTLRAPRGGASFSRLGRVPRTRRCSPGKRHVVQSGSVGPFPGRADTRP